MAKILYVENIDRYFLTHRLPLVKATQAAGYEVCAAAGYKAHADEIRQHGIPFFPIPLKREGMNPRDELQLIQALFTLYGQEKPDLIHHFNVKPVTYGAFAARYHHIPVVNTITGLGQGLEPKPRLRFELVKALYRVALQNPHSVTTFQNPDDRAEMQGLGLIGQLGNTHLIYGSGVDTERFKSHSEPETPPVIAFAGRLMWSKGANDFIELARRLRGRGWRFVMIGAPDPDNRGSVPEAQLQAWVNEGLIEWWGYQADMPSTLSRISLLLMPSEREGIPKTLVETASVGRPIIAYDVPGCREIVQHAVNGLIVPDKDVDALEQAVLQLMSNPLLARQYGEAGRRLVQAQFSIEQVISQFHRIYQAILKP